MGGEIEKIVGFLIGADGRCRGIGVVLVGRADEGEAPFIGNGEDDAAVGALKEIALVMVEQPAGDDMASAHQPHPVGGIRPDNAFDHAAGPGAAGIDQHPRTDLPFRCRLVCGCRAKGDQPAAIMPDRADNFCARHDRRAAGGRVTGVQHDKTGILDPAVGIFIPPPEFGLQRFAGGVMSQIKRRRAGKDVAPAKMVIEEQAQADQPGRTAALHPRHDGGHDPRYRRAAFKAHVGFVGKNEAHGPGNVRHRAQQDFALDQRFADKPEFQIFKIAQPAVKQLCRGRRGRRAEIAHLGKADTDPAPRGVAGDATAIDTAADDEQVKFRDVAWVRHLTGFLGHNDVRLPTGGGIAKAVRRRCVRHHMVDVGYVGDPDRRAHLKF